MTAPRPHSGIPGNPFSDQRRAALRDYIAWRLIGRGDGDAAVDRMHEAAMADGWAQTKNEWLAAIAAVDAAIDLVQADYFVREKRHHDDEEPF